MTPHEKVAELLALSAAGLLGPDEERNVQSHLHECAECCARSAEFTRLSAGLGKLPMPTPPPFLAARTEARLAAAADRRQAGLLAGLAAAMAWAMTIVCWFIYRAVTPGALSWLVAWCLVLPLLTIPVAAAIVRRAHAERSIL